MKRSLLLLLALRWLTPTSNHNPPPLFRVHCSTRQVTCLAHGAIGTRGGLRRAGSTRVELPGLAVRGICAEAVASEAGLFQGERCLDRGPAWSVTSTPHGLVSGHNQGRLKFWSTGGEVHCPCDSPIHSLVWDGRTLLAASQHGLWSIDSAGALEMLATHSPGAARLTCLLAYPGGLLVGTTAGAYRRSDGHWETLAGGVVNVSALALSNDGRAYVGTSDRGLFEERNGVLTAVLNTPRHITALLWTEGGLVVGSDQGAYLEGKPLYDWHGEISGNHITALACSRTSVWAGTYQNGLSLLKNGQDWSPIEGLPSTGVNQLRVSGDNVLVRFSNGLALQSVGRGNCWRTTGRSSGWNSALGQGWVAILSAFYAPQGRPFTPQPELQEVTVTAVARFRRQFWLASPNGVYRLDPHSGCCHRYVDELPDRWVTCLESYHGELWTGTLSGGLCHFDGRCWHRVPSDLLGERIHCLLATPAGLWIGTPRGLVWTDNRCWRVFAQTEGLPSNAVWSLASRGDELWVGTESGLCQASQRALTT